MPTLSVALITYNQEAFVAEALHSLLTQDHPGFELVLADDASTDRTREVIEATLAAYPHPHIRVVRAYRPANGGVLNNVNGAMAACTGEVIVAAAGDDISEPMRLRVIEEAFLDPTVQLVCTNYQKVDVWGRPFGTPPPKPAGGRFSHRTHPRFYGGAPVCGATAAYRASLFHDFGPMQMGTHGEDNCYWIRALLRGVIHYDDRPLLRWRQHGANLSNSAAEGFVTPDSRARHLRWLQAHETMGPQWERDTRLAMERGWVSRWQGRRVLAMSRRECARWGIHRCTLDITAWSEWIAAAQPLFWSFRWGFLFRSLKQRVSERRRERLWSWWARVRAG